MKKTNNLKIYIKGNWYPVAAIHWNPDDSLSHVVYRVNETVEIEWGFPKEENVWSSMMEVEDDKSRLDS